MRKHVSAAAGFALGIALIVFAVASSESASGRTHAPAAATTYGVDLGHSNILFKCKHLDVSYQWGRFDRFEGSFTLSDDVASSNVEITVDAASVNSNDENRDKHLRGADFFDAKQFPEMSFQSTGVEAKGDAVFSITGDLTLHGVTRSIEFEVTKVGEAATRMGDRAGFEGSFVIDRMDYGISAYGDMLGHAVHMHFAIEGVKG